MNYLVTGAAGFIGTNFVLSFLKNELHEDDFLIALDKVSEVSNNVVPSIKDNRLLFLKINLLDKDDLEEVFKKYKIGCVINFAAETHVDRSILNPEYFFLNNVIGTANLLELSYKYKVKRFHQVSTDEVYGDTSINSLKRFKETSTLKPNNPYSASKASADLIVLSYYKTYKMNVTISRSSNNFGEYQYKEKLIPLVVSKALKGEKIPLYGDGKNIRDWINVKDHNDAIEYILKHGKKGNIYNISTHNEHSNIELVTYILKKLNKSLDLIFYSKDRLGHDKRYALDTIKLENLGFKFKNEHSFFEDLDECIEKLKEDFLK